MPVERSRSDIVTTALTLSVRNASQSHLWDLKALGIKELLDKETKEAKEIAAKEFFSSNRHSGFRWMV